MSVDDTYLDLCEHGLAMSNLVFCISKQITDRLYLSLYIVKQIGRHAKKKGIHETDRLLVMGKNTNFLFPFFCRRSKRGSSEI